MFVGIRYKNLESEASEASPFILNSLRVAHPAARTERSHLSNFRFPTQFYVTKYTTGPKRAFYRQSITILLPSLTSIVSNWVKRG